MAMTKMAPPIVGVFALLAWFGTYLLMGWCVFCAIAHAMYLGNMKSVKKKAMKKPKPALTEMY